MAASTFMNGSSKTLTHSLLANLFKGNAAISLLPYTSAGVASFGALDFGGADQIYTIKDSFQISQADPTSTEIKIDQKDETIDTVTEKGEWTISGNVPTIAQEILEVFYTKSNTTVSGVEGQDGTTSYSGEAFFSEPKEVYATMMVESSSLHRALIFAKVKMIAGVSMDDSSNPAYLKLTMTILANDESTGLVGDWCSLKTA